MKKTLEDLLRERLGDPRALIGALEIQHDRILLNFGQIGPIARVVLWIDGNDVVCAVPRIEATEQIDLAADLAAAREELVRAGKKVAVLAATLATANEKIAGFATTEEALATANETVAALTAEIAALKEPGGDGAPKEPSDDTAAAAPGTTIGGEAGAAAQPPSAAPEAAKETAPDPKPAAKARKAK